MANPSLSINSDGSVKCNLPLETPGEPKGSLLVTALWCLLLALISCIPIGFKFWCAYKKKIGLEVKKVKCERVKANIRVNEYRQKMGIRQAFKRPENTNMDDSSKPKEPLKSESLNDTLNKHIPNRSVMVGGMITQGEIAIIFSPTSQGKSIIAMQIGIEVAGGSPTSLVANDATGQKVQDVCIYDVEQDDIDIHRRYGGTGFNYPANIERVPNCFFEDGEDLINDIRGRMKGKNGDVTIIIDNITSIVPSLNGEPVKDLFKDLKKLQESYNTDSRALTFIIISHTPKADTTKEPKIRDLAGSSNYGNFASCVFALWPTNHGESYKMLCVLKARKFEFDNTGILLKLENDPYLHFMHQKECLVEELLLNRKIEDDESKTDESSSDTADLDKDPKTSTLAGNGQVTTEQVVEKWVELKTKKDDKTIVGLSDPQMRKAVRPYLHNVSERTIDRHLKTKVLEMHGEGKTDNDIAKELFLEDVTVQRYLKEPTDIAS